MLQNPECAATWESGGDCTLEHSCRARTRTNAFDSYLKAANELSREQERRDDPIARYLDLMEKEY